MRIAEDAGARDEPEAKTVVTGYVLVKVGLAEDSDGEAAAQEVFDLVGNFPLEKIEYVLSASWTAEATSLFVNQLQLLHSRSYATTADEVWGRNALCGECGVLWPCATIALLGAK